MTTKLAELFTEDEWTRFVRKAKEEARSQGAIFMVDESLRLVSERAWAAQLRDTMYVLGFEEFAARIVLENYPDPYNIVGSTR